MVNGHATAVGSQPDLHLTRRYLLALGMIGLFCVTITVIREIHHLNHVEMVQTLDTGSKELRLVQRTSIIAGLIAIMDNEANRAQGLFQFNSSLQQLRDFMNKPSHRDVPKPLQDYISRYFTESTLYAQSVGDWSVKNAHYQALHALAQGPVYEHMLAALQHYSDERESRLNHLLNTERVLLFLTLLLLVAEALLIFQPMVRQVHKSQDYLVQLSKLKSEFMANMSHEIRTPINAIFGLGELLLQSEMTGKQHGQVETLMHSADALLNIIDDILDFSKIEAGRLEIQSVPFDLHLAVEDVAELLASKAREKRLEIIVRYMPGTPQFVMGDPGRVRQVLMNLVSNAIKFTDTGYVLITVDTVGEENRDGDVLMRISVEDTGIGIHEEKLHRIFDKFAQGDGSTTRKYGGTGLGLTISKQLSMLMGGDIGVTSEEGCGSTFWFTMRVSKATESGRFEPSHAILQRKRVLVIDDIDANRLLLQDSLNNAQMDVTVVASGKAGLKELRRAFDDRHPYDLVLVDYLMPEMNGETVIRAMRNDATLRDLPVIVLSSAEEKGFIKIFSSMQVAAYLAKPVRRQQLLDMMAMVLEAHVRGEHVDMLTIHATEALRAKMTFEHGVALNGVRLLLTEDNRVNREFTTEMLETMGCQVDHAENGEVALQRCREKPYDIILMDCQMPVMDGFEAAKEIQAMKSRGEMGDVPIIALTANAMDGDRERCLRAGMHDYLSKPVRRAHLEAMLMRWLKNICPVPIHRMGVPAGKKTLPVSMPNHLPPPIGIDQQALAETRLLVGDKIEQITLYFLEDGERYIRDIEQAMHQALKTSDFIAPAHTLKSSAYQFGLLTLSEFAKRIEEIGRTAPSIDEARAAIAPMLTPLRMAFSEASLYLSSQRFTS